MATEIWYKGHGEEQIVLNCDNGGDLSAKGFERFSGDHSVFNGMESWASSRNTVIGTDGTVTFDLSLVTARKSEAERSWRDQELVDFVDYYQARPLLWADLSDEQRAQIGAYRQALLDYPQQSGFPSGVRPLRPQGVVR